MSVFSKNLRYLRESRGLKLDEFEFLGIKKGTMSNYEPVSYTHLDVYKRQALFRSPEPAVALAVTTLVAGTDEVLTVRPLTHIGGRTNLQL